MHGTFAGEHYCSGEHDTGERDGADEQHRCRNARPHGRGDDFAGGTDIAAGKLVAQAVGYRCAGDCGDRTADSGEWLREREQWGWRRGRKHNAGNFDTYYFCYGDRIDDCD